MRSDSARRIPFSFDSLRELSPAEPSWPLLCAAGLGVGTRAQARGPSDHPVPTGALPAREHTASRKTCTTQNERATAASRDAVPAAIKALWCAIQIRNTAIALQKRVHGGPNSKQASLTNATKPAPGNIPPQPRAIGTALGAMFPDEQRHRHTRADGTGIANIELERQH
jgi:hypothetical protein